MSKLIAVSHALPDDPDADMNPPSPWKKPKLYQTGLYLSDKPEVGSNKVYYLAPLENPASRQWITKAKAKEFIKTAMTVYNYTE